MNYQFKFHPDAVLELEDSYNWYEQRSIGLGDRFILFVEKRLQEIIDHPERYPKKRKEYRETRIDVFPFMIVYEILENEQIIFVSYIFHAKRNPQLKYKRRP